MQISQSQTDLAIGAAIIRLQRLLNNPQKAVVAVDNENVSVTECQWHNMPSGDDFTITVEIVEENEMQEAAIIVSVQF